MMCVQAAKVSKPKSLSMTRLQEIIFPDFLGDIIEVATSILLACHQHIKQYIPLKAHADIQHATKYCD